MQDDKLICQAVSLMEEAVTVIEGIEWPADHTSLEKWLDKVTSWAIDARKAINSHTSFDSIHVQKFFQSALSLVEDAGFTGTFARAAANSVTLDAIGIDVKAFVESVGNVSLDPAFVERPDQSDYDDKLKWMADKWDARFFEMAKFISTWSNPPLPVRGAVIIGNKAIKSIGYSDSRNHAEANAIEYSNRDLTGYGIYIYPYLPCIKCMGMIIRAGIVRLVTGIREHGVSEQKVLDMAAERGLDIIRIES